MTRPSCPIRRAHPLSVLHWCSSLAILGFLPAPAAAQSLPLWPADIDTIRVVASRPLAEGRIAGTRGFVQVIPLGVDAPASADLGDLLERAVGVRIRRMGGLGAMTLASVRGSSPSQVAVTIDDIPLSTAVDALANLSLLPVRSFDTVEILRGPENGDAAGTIRLTTPVRLESPLRLRIGAGSFGTRSLSATGGGRRGPVSIFLAGGRLSSRGDYPYLDRGGTLFETGDDRIVRRSNNAFHQDDLLVRASVAPSGGIKADYTAHGLWKDGGIPGTENIQTLRVHDRFSRVLHGVSIEGRRADRLARLSAHLQEDRDRFRNIGGEIGLGRADRKSMLTARGLDASIASPVAYGASARLAATLLDERWRSRELLFGGPESNRDRLTRTAEAGGLVRIASRADLSARMRFLDAGEISGRSPRLAAAIDLGRGLGARASYGRFLRLPSFIEMYGAGGVQVGNPSLVPESGETWDAGATIHREWGAIRLYAEVAGFSSRTRNAIQWIQNSQRTSRPENLERTRVRGAEALVRGIIRASGRLPVVEMTATATMQDARDDGPSPSYHDRRLPYIPARQGSVETRIDGRRLSLAHVCDLESSLYRDRYNTNEKRRGGRVLQDLEGTWHLVPRRIDAVVSVRNLANCRTQDVDGFPLPGRSLFVQMTWTVH